MDPQDAIDLSHEAIKTCIFVGGPILVVSLVIGLLISILQAMTQLHDQSISFAPKILLLLVAIAAGLPWLSNRMIDFTTYCLEKPVVFQPVYNASSEVVERPSDRVVSRVDPGYRFEWADGPKEQPAKPFSMPMLRSANQGTRMQFDSVPLRPREAAPFQLPAFRQADQSESSDDLVSPR